MSGIQAALVVSRFVHFASCMFVFGADAFILALRRNSGGLAAPGIFPMFLRACAVGALISALFWLASVAASMSGDWRSGVDAGVLRTVLSDTGFGKVWTWRIVLAALVVLIAFADFPHRGAALFLASALLLGSVALTGHAAMGGKGAFHRVADGVHLLAGGYWMGALAVLPIVLRTAGAGGSYRVLRRFSNFGVAAVLLVLMSGIANALFVVSDWPHFLSSMYGQILLAKVVLVGAMISLACANRWLFMPALTGGSQTFRRLQHSVFAEAVVGGLVVAAASLLGTVAPPAPAPM